LSVTADRTYYVNNSPVPFDQLESDLVKITKGMDDPLIVLRFDNSLTVQDLVDVLQIGSNIKIKMVLGTQAVSKR
jgi:biopolymer transport protein ExbD